MPVVTAPERLCMQPDEKRQFEMDFANLLATGETIESSSPTPTVTATPSSLTIETIAVSSSKITFWLSAGTHGVRYRIEVQIGTSGGSTLVGDGILTVTDR